MDEKVIHRNPDHWNNLTKWTNGELLRILKYFYWCLGHSEKELKPARYTMMEMTATTKHEIIAVGITIKLVVGNNELWDFWIIGE